MPQLSADERAELRESARRLLGDRSSSARVRALADDETGHDPALWAAMAELGWPAIAVPEAHGGLGGSYTDLAVILHELGRQVTPAPVLASAVLGPAALAWSANTALAAELLPTVAAGERLLTVALSSDTGSSEPSQLSVAWSTASTRSTTSTRSTGRPAVTLDGVARFVPDAHVADHLVVSARDAAGTLVSALVDRRAPGVTIDVEPTFDQTRRLGRITFDDVAVPDERLLAEPGAGTELHDRLVSLGATAVVCDAVGAAEHVLEIATSYATTRRQFGRPIGSFQAVKHHLANMFTDVEASRAAAAFAVDALDRDGGDGGELRHAAAVAKSFAGPACARVAQLAVQVHGGIGFTWEHDAHLFLKRIKLDEALFGTAKWHRQHLATLLVDGQLAL
jgi:alkylation response protein AidB-like acyl-CoA dehydrogenase